MLGSVTTFPLPLAAYERLASRALLAQIRNVAAPLRGLRVAHISSTPQGGGVAEILHSLIPLSRDVGLDATWYTLPPDGEFFTVTKQLHNWLQGYPGEPTRRHQRTYTAYLKRVAAEMRHLAADVWVVHDPQPLPLRELVPLEAPVLWRCHIDCSTPNACVRDYVLPWVRGYDRVLFSMPQYVMPGLARQQVRIVYPAIDPLTRKNRPLPPARIRRTFSRLGIDPKRPLLTQVSRFDPWKNPREVVDIYRLAKRELPDLQLAIAGVFAARDDPEAPRIYEATREHAGSDPDIHLLTDPNAVGPEEINALQSGSSVILQRSVREGFGLTVTEAMWKARPVIASPVGGITAQVQHGKNGYLATSAEDCAAHVVQLIRDPKLGSRLGRAAQRTVERRFLLPRLLLDELSAFGELSAGGDSRQVAA